MTGIDIRKRKLTSRGRAIVVAIDHGMFDGPHSGMENVPEALKRVSDHCDAILLSPGALRQCDSIFGHRNAPLAVVRININTVFCTKWNYSEAVIREAITPQEAYQLGADLVLSCLTMNTGSEQQDAENLACFARQCQQAHACGLPVIGEYFPARHREKDEQELHDEIMVGCRMLQEFGADFIKTFHTCKFPEITTKVQIPIFGLGAEKTHSDFEALLLAERQIRDGAGGVVFGRNALQASNPGRFLQALNRIVNEGMLAEQCVEEFGLTRQLQRAARS